MAHFDRDALIFKALVALDEIQDQAGSEPMQPSYALRFTLAWLYSVSDGDRSPYDRFFSLMLDPIEWRHSPERAAYYRSTYMRTQMTVIARSVGLKVLPDIMLRRARLPKAEREAIKQDEESRAAFVKAIRRSEEEAAELDRRRRVAQDGGFGAER